MKTVSEVGIAVMTFYKGAVRARPEIAELGEYLVAVNQGWGVAFLWLNGCKDHEEARSSGMARIAAESDHAEYAVVGPCNDGDSCGKTRIKTYFRVRS